MHRDRQKPRSQRAAKPTIATIGLFGNHVGQVQPFAQPTLQQVKYKKKVFSNSLCFQFCSTSSRPSFLFSILLSEEGAPTKCCPSAHAAYSTPGHFLCSQLASAEMLLLLPLFTSFPSSFYTFKATHTHIFYSSRQLKLAGHSFL